MAGRTLTRKHYVLIATALRTAREGVSMASMPIKGTDAVDAVMYQLADALELNNPRFTRGRFYDACRGVSKRTSKPVARRKRVAAPSTLVECHSTDIGPCGVGRCTYKKCRNCSHHFDDTLTSATVTLIDSDALNAPLFPTPKGAV